MRPDDNVAQDDAAGDDSTAAAETLAAPETRAPETRAPEIPSAEIPSAEIPSAETLSADLGPSDIPPTTTASSVSTDERPADAQVGASGHVASEHSPEVTADATIERSAHAPELDLSDTADVSAAGELGAGESSEGPDDATDGATDRPAAGVSAVAQSSEPDAADPDDPVAQAAALLETVPGRPLADHAAVFGQVHAHLQQALAEIDNA